MARKKKTDPGGALAIIPKVRGSAARTGSAITQNRTFATGGRGRGNVAPGTGGENSRVGKGKRAAGVQGAAAQSTAATRDARRAEKIRNLRENTKNAGEWAAANAALRRITGKES